LFWGFPIWGRCFVADTKGIDQKKKKKKKKTDEKDIGNIELEFRTFDYVILN